MNHATRRYFNAKKWSLQNTHHLVIWKQLTTNYVMIRLQNLGFTFAFSCLVYSKIIYNFSTLVILCLQVLLEREHLFLALESLIFLSLPLCFCFVFSFIAL